VLDSPEVVVHVTLAHWADVAVVAPASANVLAKLALGLADDLLTSTLLEASCPLVLAPAMHTGMWGHPATQEHVATLRKRGATIVGPAEGKLAVGDEGLGRMAEPIDVLEAVARVLSHPQGSGAPPGGDLSARRILITAGPTHEPIDAVRYIGNRSSGKMGFAVATEAARRGAQVTVVSGPVALPDLPGVQTVRVETAEEMARAVLERYADADAVVMAAAVADFRPAHLASGKIKKDAGPPDLSLVPTDDILRMLGKGKEHQVLVGFAAETSELESEGRRKLAEKNLDFVVVNEVGRPGTGFGADTNRAAILAASGEDTPLREWTKGELARSICDRLAGALDHPDSDPSRAAVRQ
jgi:phosphopantothenoylcysteine decarboxylase/phosphopantothenate--cysteine ligase